MYVTVDQNPAKFAKKTAFWILDDFLSIARCSKYDFWILGQILGRRSKKYFENKYFFEMKLFFEEVEKIFFETKKNSEKNPMKKSIKNENFAKKTTKDFPIKKCEFAWQESVTLLSVQLFFEVP